MKADKVWTITVWGTRGSFPAASANFLEYGGNTSCISVDCGGELVAFDAGSGLTGLGERILQEGRRRIDIFLTHLHLDHIMGLFPFAPRYDRRAEIHLYGMPGFARELTRLVGSALWPVDLADGRARVFFHEVWDGRPFPLAGETASGLTVTAMEGCHPGGCYYYRLEGNGRSLVYALDCELSREMFRELTDFAQGTDLLVWDASFTSKDAKPGWGHSTWEEGLTLARAAEARQVLMTHFSTGYTDEFLREQERLARAADSAVCFAKERMRIEL